MKKLVAVFFFLFLYLLTFILVTNQFRYHSLVTASNLKKTKTPDQLAKEAWEFKEKRTGGNGVIRDYDYPLQLEKGELFALKRIGIKGINQANNNLLETVKETTSLKTYDQLSEKVKAELRNLVKIPDWSKKLRNLFKTTERKWEKNFWNKIRKKYFLYLNKYSINSISIDYFSFYISKKNLSSLDIVNLSFENLSTTQKNIIPTIYHSNWELFFRKAINTAARKVNDDPPFLTDAKSIWQNNFRSDYLPDLKNYSLREIHGVKIASLLTLIETSWFVNFTFQQQEQIHNLVDLINYQMLLKAAINQEKQAEAFWTDSASNKKIRELFHYDLFTVANISLDQLTNNDLLQPYLDLTTQQQEQIKKLLSSANYQKKIDALLNKEQQTETFWNSPATKKELIILLQFPNTILGEIGLDKLKKEHLTSSYLSLNLEQRVQVRKLSQLVDLSQAVQKAVAKAESEDEEVDKIFLILGLSIGIPSFLLQIVFIYLYLKKKMKKREKMNKNSHK